MSLENEIAELLWDAQQRKEPCDPVRGRFENRSEQEQAALAYSVQQINIQRQVWAGRRIVGRKIGLTSPAVQKQLGVDRPDFGTLLDDMAVVDGEPVDTSRLLQPKVEAEIALVLERDLTYERHTVADLIGATAYALAAIEVVGSRIAGWNIRFVDTVADNASSGLFVLGTQPVPLSRLDLAGVSMRMTRGEETVSQGAGAACLGNPLNAARWLADTLVQVGTPMRAGDVILTGALGPMVAVEAGQTYVAHIDGFAPVRAIFS
ncbi:fumarylacetoacetate hydrolase family protein [Burkholderia multivorans]|uniref:2-keto-4-pentenoate hydratase n=1 Tax=Burkholderia multivorans TaxID=87883 RepID=UPI000CFE97B1|nr:fumarylacetoacetate hydrolase family protein [Burkholderia multivorans]MBU9312569.1 fumarylacetoacetate hydrolase family protein [Burkholderia multivorans]MCA8250743.1 fumarylacetoacetate hydrolase family protein [Burkholderia multivorans]MCA8457302.1 fumarylacetoacetate hydrolase family protein [Burkholderia multivorans]MDN7870416.1 fumarylacetoacetate hydrolase family protein [Burkholderia multivorans]PRH26446.1 2-keto-4-pentenoate hydratase [Burkholderia multivorans]